MQQIADFHIHSRYSRACSRDLTLANIDKACRIKGIDIIGTGDFTFPDWFKSINEELEEIKNVNPPTPFAKGGAGLYKLKSANDDNVRFILTTELALIYKKGDKCRRIHIVLQAPNREAVKELNDYLGKKYNIRSDGRPILGMTTEELVKLCLSIHPKFLIYPAHIWTPWFSVFGSKSGFNSFPECFGEYTNNIFAYETGLSSDPEMNWRVSELDKYTLLSNSDAHSLPNLAREANVFDLSANEITYDGLYDAIKNKKSGKLKFTIEFYPEEGMYHYDGHRACNIRFSPAETKKNKGICPVCKKPLIIGVMYRVDELADRPLGFKPDNASGFKKLVELDKIIAESLNIKSRSSVKVQIEYKKLIQNFGNELNILLAEDINNIKAVAGSRLAEGIKRMRSGNIIVLPGFDGQYGEVKIFNDKKERQTPLL
jgi:uncharacterized protein (TIGR00375 family)